MFELRITLGGLGGEAEASIPVAGASSSPPVPLATVFAEDMI